MAETRARAESLRAQFLRIVGGIVCCAVGGVWIAQGSGNLKGSFMSGHSQWTIIGVLLLAVGLGLFVWAWQTWIGRDPVE
jgi:hypothetical protein